MKKYSALAAFFVVVMMTSIPTRLDAQIDGQDITINNGDGSSPSDYSAITGNTNPDPRVVNGTPVDALGNVNVGDVATKNWDLEAFGYNSTTSSLTYIGGYNPAEPTDGIPLGDIFIAPGTSLVQQTGGGTVGGGDANANANTPYTNPGYTYAIHITGTTQVSPTTWTLTYNIYQLTKNAQVLTVSYNNYGNNPLADPYALDLAAGGYSVYGSDVGLTTTITAEDNNTVNTNLTAYGKTGSTPETLFDTTDDTNQASNADLDNFVVSFNLSSLDLSSFEASVTEQCGNDDLKGLYVTPEPKSIYFALLAAILPVVCFRLLRGRAVSMRDLDLT